MVHSSVWSVFLICSFLNLFWGGLAGFDLGVFWGNFSTVFYCLGLLFLTLKIFISLNKMIVVPPKFFIPFLFWTLFLQIFLIFGLSYYSHPEGVLWVSDSYSTHLPLAVQIVSALENGRFIVELVENFPEWKITQIIVGVFFYLFGKSAVVSSLAITIFGKGLAIFGIFLLGKKIFSEKVALGGVWVYGVLPTVTFYTTSFYKEAVVHGILTFSLYFLYVSLVEKKNGSYILLVLSLFALSIERMYLVPPFLVVIPIYLLASRPFFSLRNIFLQVSSIGFAMLFYVYFTKEYYNFGRVIGRLVDLRQEYSKFPDVNYELNYQIPYFLAFVKILFTPFFTFQKLQIFKGPSTLITWGGLVGSIVTCFSIVQLCKNKFSLFFKVWMLVFPFAWFLFLFAYLAPYSGRQRDGFFPLLVLIFSSFVFDFMNHKKVNN